LQLPVGAIAKFGAYASGLQESSERANLVGILDGDRFAEELLLDSLRALPLLDRLGETGSLIDVGSGAGLPGIPLAIARPTWRVTCLEPRLKRARFLTTAKVMVGLPHVEVIQGRLEEQERTWDLACSRAVFEPLVWLELARPIVREQGHLLCYATERNKPLGTDAERLGWSEVAEVTYPGPGGDRVVVLYRRN
jgi:16S rRNA (guanine527-N7)-methyltransferase